MSALWGLVAAARSRAAWAVAGAGAVALALLEAYRTVREGGRQAQQLDTFKQAEQDRAKADGAADKVVRMDDAAVDRELRAKFSRGP